MTLTENVRVHTERRKAYITLSRAEKKNALSPQVVQALTKAVQEAAERADVKVIILQAEGDVFSAGADIAYLQQLQNFSYEENLADSRKFEEMLRAFYTCPKVIVAQVQGHAIAGGCGLVTACDFAFAVPEARFGYTEVRIGFVPALVSVLLLRRTTGAVARDLLLTGRLLTAYEARDAHLIYEVVEANQLQQRVEAFTDQLIENCSAQSLQLTKELLWKLPTLDLFAAWEYAAQRNAFMRSTDDFRKGIAAFLNRQSPKW
ncbi:MAG: enoyl-CoA hydratase-related protein [Chitinophagales bacterium]|nr:enoyl-CoA hydratase-related protein [Chitinophagales bacterium]MDW8427395.1 enoyl-CoA hydratase-related protein [Chitinophagales bacterium]